jgi:sucrose-6-phosphate hydrolase SacC (GH32 family)
VLGESGGNELKIGYDEKTGQYYIDRTRAGLASFNADFAAIAKAPCVATGDSIRLTIIVDKSSVELLADGGKTVMTAVYFPERPYTKAILNYTEGFPVQVEYAPLKKK